MHIYLRTTVLAAILLTTSIGWTNRNIEPAQAAPLTLDQTWMRSGERFDMEYKGPSGETFAFKVYVATVDLSRIEFRWQFTGENMTYVPATWVERSNRTRVDAPGFSDFMWINLADVNAGIARIGRETATLTQNTLTQITFTSASTRYAYDPTTGLLRSATELDGSNTIRMVTRGTGISVPQATERPSVDTVRVLDEGATEMKTASMDTTSMPAEEMDWAVTTCEGTVAHWSGEAAWWCGGGGVYYSYDGYAWKTIGRGYKWDNLAHGNVSIIIHDGLKEVARHECRSVGPRLSGSQIDCSPLIFATPVEGSHVFKVYGKIEACLDPAAIDKLGKPSPFSCNMEMEAHPLGLQLVCDSGRSNKECRLERNCDPSYDACVRWASTS